MDSKANYNAYRKELQKADLIVPYMGKKNKTNKITSDCRELIVH